MSQPRLMQRSDIEARFPDRFAYADFLQTHSGSLGIQAWNGNQFFDIRGENHPSVRVNDGWWFDYGSSKRGDTLDLVAMAQNISLDTTEGFMSVMRIVENLLGEASSFTSYEPKKRDSIENFLPPVETSDIRSWFAQRKEFPGLYKNILDGFLRFLTDEEKRIAVKKMRIGLCIKEVHLKNKDTGEKYSFTDRRIIFPEYDSLLNPKTFYSYNRKSKRKAIKRSSENGVRPEPCLSGMHLVSTFTGQNILCPEGHTDYGHAIGLNMQAVTPGSASSSVFKFLKPLSGKTIYFLPDNDKAGATAMARWYLDVLDFNGKNPDKHVKFEFIWWSEKTLDIAMEEVSSFIQKKKRLLPEDPKLFNILNGLKPIIIFKDDRILKKGYDFSDFVESFRGSEAFNWFLTNFSY